MKTTLLLLTLLMLAMLTSCVEETNRKIECKMDLIKEKCKVEGLAYYDLGPRSGREYFDFTCVNETNGVKDSKTRGLSDAEIKYCNSDLSMICPKDHICLY